MPEETHKQPKRKSSRKPGADNWSRAADITEILHPSKKDLERLEKTEVSDRTAAMLAESLGHLLAEKKKELYRFYREETEDIISYYNNNCDIRRLQDRQLLNRLPQLKHGRNLDLRTRLRELAAIMRAHVAMRSLGAPRPPNGWLAKRLLEAP